MANELKDNEMIGKITNCDFVAMGAKYHLLCLMKYKNQHRSMIRSTRECDESKARAFAELVSSIETSVEEGKFLFKIYTLHTLNDLMNLDILLQQ